MATLIPESDEVKRYRISQARASQMKLLESRLRRRLNGWGMLVLHKSRGEKQQRMFGDYWVSDRLHVMPILHHVDLPSLARQLRLYFADLDLLN
jgi:succinate dehydrogenase/fumarate reductase flavoprotein subunit